MKRNGVIRFLSLSLAVIIAVGTFSINSEAANVRSSEHKRDLTAEELTALATLFNAEQYAAYYPDVEKVLGDDPKVLFSHFVNFGLWEERQPCVHFNVNVYASENEDLRIKYGDDIVAYYMDYISTAGKYRYIPAPLDALRRGFIIYSVYDFRAGQSAPVDGAVAVLSPVYHPGYDY